jgi:hypothetical protein
MTISSTQAKKAACHWKDGPAFLRPNGILLYSNRPKGVVMTVFWTSSIGWQGSDDTLSAGVNLEESRAASRLGGEIQHVGQGVEIVQQVWACGSHRRDASFSTCPALQYIELVPVLSNFKVL